MKKHFFLLAGAMLAGRIAVMAAPATDTAYTEGENEDSVRMIYMQQVEVFATRATAKTPMAFSTIDRKEIENVNTGADMPFLLLMTPSAVATSDAGAGVGYTGIRIRGTDATRINVTANGIPMNDAESHGLFWVNTPDIAASVEDIQIQRGVGTSTNGAGAFGASINIKTRSLSPRPYAEVSGSYGSFNTHRQSIDVGTGLLNGKWAFNTRLSNVGSDGYIDRASTSLKSYFFQGGYYGRNTVVKFLTFAGKEETYHAWNGQTKDEIAERGRRYNPSGEIEEVVRDADGRPVLDGNGDPKTRVVGFYDDQTDNYTQSNYQLLFTQYLSDRWSLNVNFHYTDGYGYYEEYKNARTLLEYGLIPFTPADPSKEAYLDDDGKVSKSNLVRRKIMDNRFGGGVFSLNYTAPGLAASLGGAANRYGGDHFGRVIWVQNYSGDPSFSPGHEFYRNRGEKSDANIYLKANWQAFEGFHVFGDMQYRRIGYRIEGAGDNWDWNKGAMQRLDVDKTFNFLNPKAGVMYDFCRDLSAYASVAVAHREPTRNNYTDARSDREPRAERLTDYEAGVTYRSGTFSAGAAFFYMKYRDQLVLTGEVNHIGEPLADNVPDSYRAGVELTAGAQLTRWLRWDANAAFSRNRIRNYTEYVDNYDENWDPLYTQTPNHIGGTDISFSPRVTFGSLISARFDGFGIGFQSNYVGSQYMTNSMQDDVKLSAYFVNNLRLDYTFKAPSLDSVTLGFAVNNIFNEKYFSNGYGGSSYVIDADGGRERSNWSYYFPQADANVMANVILRF